MKQYKDLDLKAIQKAVGIDFAHYTGIPGFETEEYTVFLTDFKKYPRELWLNDASFNKNKFSVLLFNNGTMFTDDGPVSPSDYIEFAQVFTDNLTQEQVNLACKLLTVQLGDDYVVYTPELIHDEAIEVRFYPNRTNR